MYKIIKDIYGFKGYKVDNYGNIYSFKTKGGFDFNKKPKILKPGLDGKGKYLHVTLRKNNKNYCKNIHVIVCSTFNGKRLDYYWVSHENGNNKDNRACNLKWRTPSENHKLKIKHGTDDCGIKNSRALFSLKQLNNIRKLISKGITLREIAKKYNCDERDIGKIKRGERYARS